MESKQKKVSASTISGRTWTKFGLAPLDFRSKTSKFLNKDIQNVLATVGYPVVKENLSKKNESSTQSKRKRCSVCEYSMDKKTSTQCSICSVFVCAEHSVKRIFCITCSK